MQTSNITLSALKHRNNKWIAIKSANETPINNAIKTIEGRTFSVTNKCWLIPYNEQNFLHTIKVLEPLATIDTSNFNTIESTVEVNKISPPVKVSEVNVQTKYSLHKIHSNNRQVLSEVLEMLQLKAYSESTIRTYLNEISQFLQTIKHVPAENFTTERIKRYLNYCYVTLRLSENTLHSRINALKFYYEQVLKNEKIFWEIPRPKKPLQLPKVLGERELKKLFDAATNLKHKAILFVAYGAGLRVSEVINLRIQDIDRERQQLFIHCSKGKKDRYVRLSPLVLDILEQYYKLSKVKPINYVFEGLEKGQPYTIRSAQQIFADCKRKAGILKSLSFHSLRHSFATHTLEKGIDVVFIQDILGHFDIKTTKRYLHVRKDILINIESPIESLYRK